MLEDELGLAKLADVTAMMWAGSIPPPPGLPLSPTERIKGLLLMLGLTTVILGGLLAAARWRARAPREVFVRFHAGLLLVWWLQATNSMRFHVGALKVPWLQLIGLLGTSRSALDVLVHAIVVALLVVVALRLSQRSWPVQAVAACLLYLAISDPLFVGDYFIAPVVLGFFWCCLPTARGGLAGLQLQMVLLMVGAGWSKVGPHFDRPTAAHVAWLLQRFVPPSLFWRGPEDLRPTSFASAVGAATVLAEVLLPLLLFLPSRKTVKLAVAALALMHVAMAVCTIVLTFMEAWMIMMWCYLFLGGDRDGPRYGFDYAGLKAMPHPVRLCMMAFCALNVSAQLQPSMDWHPFVKFNHFASGNQPVANPVLIRRGAAEKLFGAQLAETSDFSPGLAQTSDGLVSRWFLELNYKPSVALVGCALVLAGGNTSDYGVTFSEYLVPKLAGGDSSSMNNYNLHLFRALKGRGALDFGDVLQVWMEPLAWPQLPLGRQVSAWSIWDGQRGLLKSGELTPAQLHSVQLPSHAFEFLPPECRGPATKA